MQVAHSIARKFDLRRFSRGVGEYRMAINASLGFGLAASRYRPDPCWGRRHMAVVRDIVGHVGEDDARQFSGRHEARVMLGIARIPLEKTVAAEESKIAGPGHRHQLRSALSPVCLLGHAS